MQENTSSEEIVTEGQGPGVGNLLSEPHHTRADCRLAARAVRERWSVPESTKSVMVARLTKIVETEFAVVTMKNGMSAAVEGPADVNAIAASRVLVLMERQNQADQHLSAKIEAGTKRKSSGDTFNIGCVGQIALGQDPVTPEDARRQAQEVLARVRARTGGLIVPPTQANTVIDVQPFSEPAQSLPQQTWGLDDL